MFHSGNVPLSEVSYKSSFHNWDKTASVRAKPVRYLHTADMQNKLFFTPELVPILEHPLVMERGVEAAKKILIYHLYAHLDFTENLEHEVVNYVAYKIGRKNIGIDLPEEMIKDAWKLYVDEAYHFKFSADLVNQVERMTGVETPKIAMPKFLSHLYRILDNIPNEKKDLIYIFYSIISETLITGTLDTVPQDERVVQTVRDVIGDHAADERRHHAYFANLLGKLWERLTPANQKLVGPLLPKFIFGFIEPDYGVIRTWLRLLHFSPKEIERIMEESYPKERVIQDVRCGSKVTLRHLKKTGVFENSYTAEEFDKSGLLVAE